MNWKVFQKDFIHFLGVMKSIVFKVKVNQICRLSIEKRNLHGNWSTITVNIQLLSEFAAINFRFFNQFFVVEIESGNAIFFL